MNKAVVVFAFPEPKDGDDITLGIIAETAKSLFAGIEQVKVYAAIKEPAQKVISIFEGEDEEEGNLVKHARRELALINNDEDFNNSIIEAVRAFSRYGHSGGSASVAIPILNDLLQFKNLAPLTDDKNEWMEVSDYVWQSTRNPEAFSDDRGKTYYLLSERDNASNGESLPTHVSEIA